MVDKKWLRSEFGFKHVFSILFLSLSALIGSLIFTNSISSTILSSSFLKDRNFHYSVQIDKNIGEDCYGFYDGKITFCSDILTKNSIGGSVLMRTQSIYTINDLLNGTGIQLDKNDVAISENIANSFKLNTGSTIYCKNKVNNEVEEYKIVSIIPFNYRIDSYNISNEKGLIIFGYNNLFEESINAKYIYFYEEDSSLINKKSALIEENTLISKHNQIKTLRKDTITKILISFIISLSSFLLMNAILSLLNKNIYGFKRRCGISEINKIIVKDFGFYCVLSLSTSMLVYLLWSLLSSAFSIVLLLTLVASSLLSLFVGSISTIVYQRRKF